MRLTAALLALTTADPAAAGSPRLAGIVVAGQDRVAIFAGGPGEATLAIREGDVLGDERIVGFAARGVWLDGPAGKRLATLDDDPSGRAALEAAVPRPPLIDPYRRERETENDQ